MLALRSWMIALVSLVVVASSVHAEVAGPLPDPDEPSDTQANDPNYDPRDMRTEGLDDEIARQRFSIAQSLYEAGRFQESAEEFEGAYALSPRSSLLFNAYLAWRDAGRLGDAVRTLGLYLENTPEAPDHEQLSNRLRAMREQLAADRARADAEAAAAEAERQRLADEAEAHRRQAEAERRRARAAEAEPHPVGFIVGGIGAAMLLGGGILAFIAHDRATTLEDACPNRRCPATFDLDGELSGARRMQRATDTLILGSVGVIAAGVIMAFTVKRHPRRLREDVNEPEAEVTPTAGCTGTGCSLGLQGQF